MKEVIFKQFEEKKEYAKEKCQSCGGKIYHSQIPCPNPPGKNVSCLVIHYGYICENCRKVWQ